MLDDIKKTLWASADKLRANMDAAEYKHLVLGLIFVKYISDAFVARQTELKTRLRDPADELFYGDAADEDIAAELEDRDYYTSENVFWVPEGARWEALRAAAPQPDIGKRIDDALSLIEADNPKLKGILDKRFARAQLPDGKLGELVNLISTIGFGNDPSKARDILGQVYEYFLGMFASAEGKRGGQFYTPASIVKTLVAVLSPSKGQIYDPCCGSSGMFVQSEKFIEDHGGKLGDVSIYGQEANPTTWRLAAMNLVIRGMDYNLGKEPADTFTRNQHPDLRADYVLANPPFNISDWWHASLDGDARWEYGTPPQGNANYAWLQHILHHLKPTGRAGIVLANGSMSSSQNSEGQIRAAMVDADVVEVMVALPGQLFFNTQIPACLWFLAKQKKRKGEVLFIDARKLGSMISRVQSELTDEVIERISQTVAAWRGESLPTPSRHSREGGNPLPAYQDIPGFCRSVPLAEIAQHGHVLTPGRYVGAEEVEDDDDPRLARASNREVVLSVSLRAAIDRLNPAVPAAAREDAFRHILDMGQPALLSGNRAFHRVLVTGVPVQYQKDGETRGDFVRLIDWQDAQRNEWLAVQQFTIKGPRHTRRPDIILFVNGLPLVLIELKNPADLNADIWKAYDQIQTYKEQVADVFTYNELLVISDGTEARMGSLSANAERFMQWRTIDGVALDPLGKFQELETLVRGVLAPAYLLDYLRFFVLFEDDGTLVKKVAGYHQFHAVRAAVEQVVTAASTDEASRRGKGGVVWHTQGSGKSITMTCFAARVMQEPRLQNPTIVVITDRNDLDGQLLGVFSLSQDLLREQPQPATTRQRLRELLDNRPSGGIVFATIQKFMPGEDEDTFPVLSQRRNVVVIADEAHRTQYGFEAKLKSRKAKDGSSPAVAYTTGDSQTVASTADFAPPEYQVKYQAGYAQHLRDALPNATFVAFTGTPVSSTDRDTRSVFGEYIHVYDMQQAQEDGATVAIYYESRLAKLGLNEAELSHLDDEVDVLAEDEEESQQAKLKSHWAALEKVVGAEPRIASVAADLVAHF